MAQDPNRIFVNGTATVWIGPTTATAPVDPALSTFTGFTEVGHFTEDSLSFSTSPNFEEVRSHQSDYPTRRMQTADEATLSVDLQEWSGQNFIYAFGGGSVVETSVGSGIWKYTPPALGARSVVQAFVKCVDGSKIYGLVIPRCMQVEGVEQNLAKGSESLLPLRLAVLGGAGAAPWYWLVDDDTAGAWAAAVPTLASRTPASGAAAANTAINYLGTNLNAVTGVRFGRSSVAATGSPTTTSIPTGGTFIASQFVNYTVTGLTGTAGNIGVARTCSANNTTTLTVAAFPVPPVAGDTFSITTPAYSFDGPTSGAWMTVYSPTGTATATADVIFDNAVGAPTVGAAGSATGWAWT